MVLPITEEGLIEGALETLHSVVTAEEVSTGTDVGHCFCADLFSSDVQWF